jgi:hypothetical protein
VEKSRLGAREVQAFSLTICTNRAALVTLSKPFLGPELWLKVTNI